jgi:hypothetical protein
MDYTITLSEMERKSMEYIAVDVDEWITNAAKERARHAKDEIIALLIAHCNANGITIATGEAAQVDQAYELNVVSQLTDETIEP